VPLSKKQQQKKDEKGSPGCAENAGGKKKGGKNQKSHQKKTTFSPRGKIESLLGGQGEERGGKGKNPSAFWGDLDEKRIKMYSERTIITT